MSDKKAKGSSSPSDVAIDPGNPERTWWGPPSKPITGYSDRLTVMPGGEISFMVSCDEPEYEADIVRLIHGDDNPAGPGFKEIAVATSVTGRYSGRSQPIRTGSRVVVPDRPVLKSLQSATLHAFIWPTSPDKGLQGLITKCILSRGVGFGFVIAEDASVGLMIGDGQSDPQVFRTGVPLAARAWYSVACSFDEAEGTICVKQQPLDWRSSASEAVFEADGLSLLSTDAPLLIAALWTDEERPAGFFNGKIDRPAIFNRALTPDELRALATGNVTDDARSALIAEWHFETDISGAAVTDISPNSLHGSTVNLPTRGVAGFNWSGTVLDWRSAPTQYGAIHFHDDDLEEAAWESDFALQVPADLASGVYAARLTTEHGDDYVPFFVAPRLGTPSAQVAFLAPVYTYLAYANAQVFCHAIVPPARGEQAEDVYLVRHGLRSLYDCHSDGSPVYYSTSLRPLMALRPRYRACNIGCPARLSADLHLLDWLETKSQRFDVLTDEVLHNYGADALSGYRVVLTGSHSEYWTRQMLDAMETYLSQGGRLMHLGGNGMYWVTSVDPERPHVMEVRRGASGTRTYTSPPSEMNHSTTGEPGGLWQHRGRAPQKLVGVGFSAWGPGKGSPYRRLPASFDPRVKFVFEGIGDDEAIGEFGLVVGAAGGYEVDRMDVTLGTPPHALRLATADAYATRYFPAIEELMDVAAYPGLTKHLLSADMVYFTLPGGGGVFTTGSISWCGSLSWNAYDNNVSRITMNVLQRFLQGEPLPATG